MTPETFLKKFGAIANAPGGVQRLREMILQLAVMGKLVAQDPEESVDDLITICAESKKKYIDKLELRKAKPAKNVSGKDFPFQIPKNWKWVPLDHICDYIQRGKGPKYDDSSDVKVVSQKCVRWEGFDISQARGLNFEALEKYKEERFLVDGDLLWNSTGTGTAGRACIYSNTESKAVADSHVTVVRAPQINGNYIWCYIASPIIQARFSPKHPQKIVSGTTNQVELSTTNVKELPIPLPPLTEQKRITAKVNQLMALCDRLEAQQQERATLVKQARISALDELANAQGGKAIQTTWKRVQDHLSMLFDHPDDVEDLKKCILQNAVMGKLVPQNPDDEPASELLKKITEEKATLIKKGKIKRQKPLPKIREDEKPFKIPKRWVWCKIGDILAIKHGHAFKSKYFKENSGQHVLATPGNFFETGGFRKQGNKTKYYEGPIPDGFIFNPNDLMIAMTEQAAGLLGSAAFIPDDNKKYLHNQRLGKLVFSENLISKAYIFWYFNSPYLRQKVSGSSTGMKVKHTSPDKVSNILIPLPPFAEQNRIVQKTQSLLSLCIQLQKQLGKSLTIAEQLAQSVVETTTGQSTEKQEKMKTPKTELVSRLKLVKKPAAKVHAPLSAILVKNKDELSAKALWNTSGLAIDDFYRQLKIEMVNGWIAEPEKAHIRITDDQGSAQ